MQKTANGVGDHMQKSTASMFMLDPAGTSGGGPSIGSSAAVPSNIFGFLPSAADLNGAQMLPSYLAAAAAAAAAAQQQHSHYPIAYIQDEPAQLRKLFIGGLNHVSRAIWPIVL